MAKFRRRYALIDHEDANTVEVGLVYVLSPAKNPADLAALHTIAENSEPEMAADIRAHIALIEAHPDRALGGHGSDCLPYVTHPKVVGFAANRLAKRAYSGDMATQEWLSEVTTRISFSEGSRSTMYFDTMGIPTIGIGFNLRRDDAAHALSLVGANLHAVMGGAELKQSQISQLFLYAFTPIIGQARLSLRHYDMLSDARRFVICDLVYNMGYDGWTGFTGTRSLIDAACVVKDDTAKHTLFDEAGDHLASSAWFTQVGGRARRDVSMMRSSGWVPFDSEM